MPQVRLIAFAILLLLCGGISAHPTKPNKSIGATTIAIVKVLDDVVRLELEIGEADLPVFTDLIGDGAKAIPTEAQQRFFTRGFTIETDDLLEGMVKKVEQCKRTERDPVTGEPLPKPTGTSDKITFVHVEYPLKGKPTRLRLKPPEAKAGRSPNIGLVVYHRSIPINDFDFFTLRETVSLDWVDPWKSKFTGLQFARYYNAPVWATLSVEPRAVRLEVMCRPNQPELTEMRMKVDGQTAIVHADEEPTLYRQGLASYSGAIKMTAVPEESRFVCYTFLFPTARRASDVELSWPSLPPCLTEIPLWVNTATTPVKLTDKNRTHTWTSQTKPEDVWFDSSRLSRTEFKLQQPWFVAGIGCIVISIFCLLSGSHIIKKWNTRLVVFALCMLTGCCVLLPMALQNLSLEPAATLTEEEATRIVRRLLDEAYRAHEAPDEETTYDALADVVNGPLLREAYLSMKQVFDSDQVGRARIRSVTIASVVVLSHNDDAVYRLRCVWTVDVAVIHWGHTHLRSNQYEGELTIQPKDGKWMLTGLNIVDEKQLPAPSDAVP